MFFNGFLGLLVLCIVNTVQAQQYILNNQYSFRNPQDDFYNQNKPLQFQQQYQRFSGLDTYYPQRDLQTSDLPFHLQRTLPQYRYTNREQQLPKNELPYRNNVIFRPEHEHVPAQDVSPSTHRPNYLQYLSHSRHPSQSETFLGQVTLDNSFENLGNNHNNQKNNKEDETRKLIPNKFLRQHTRILAPDTNEKQNELHENKYFVNENGEVFSTTLSPTQRVFPSQKLSTKLQIEEENIESKDFPRNNIIDRDYFKQKDQIFNSANNYGLTDYSNEKDIINSNSNARIHDKKKINSKVETKPVQEEIDDIKYEEPVVSVVTTKSVINNTVIATSSSPLITTTASPVENENATDSWVVVASVQTSKSISGAHYLPSSIVAQEERLTSLNEKERQEKLNEEITTTEDYPIYEDDDSFTHIITTASPTKHSTESLIDKLDRVQSDLSSGLLNGGYKNEGNNIAVITENMTDKIQMSDIDMTEASIVASQIFPSTQLPVKNTSPLSKLPSTNLSLKRKTQANQKSSSNQKKITLPKIDSYLPPGYKVSEDGRSNSRLVAELLKNFKNSIKDKPIEEKVLSENKPENNNSSADLSHHRFAAKNNTTSTNTNNQENLLKIAKPVDIKDFLPPGYKVTTESSKTLESILNKAKVEDISAFLPPGYSSKSNNNVNSTLNKKTTSKNSKTSTSTEKHISSIDLILEKSKQEDISKFLPPGYKQKSFTTTTTPKTEDASKSSKPKHKSFSTTSKSKLKLDDIFEQSVKDDISAFLPPGYKSKSTTTRKPTSVKSNIEIEKLPTSLLPTGYKLRKENVKEESSTKSSDIATKPMSSTTTSTTTTTTGKPGLKVVFPSRPGGKRLTHKLTTPKSRDERKEVTQSPVPTIHKGWPTRATTEFTGWPTPSTTPISIEKLLESVQRGSPTNEEPEYTTVTASTTQKIVTMTTTTTRPTTPGVCVEDCNFVGTIKLVDGVKWVPELLDTNTKEWQLLANEVQTQLEELYTKSEKLKSLFKNIRIEEFSKGSVLVDYLVEMNNPNMQVSTSQMKKIFNEALASTVKSSREGKSLNETEKIEEKANLGRFIVDLEYTDFIVVPKQMTPVVGYAEDSLLLPQWAIAVIVIGLASLLFVIIFGVTVLLNRSKNAKKKVTTPLTQDMIHELNKNHMIGYDNSGIEDPYNIEVGFWDPRRMDAHREYSRLPKKGSSGSIHDNSTSNLYDSWKSQWNSYYNSNGGYYAHSNSGPGSSYRLYERRRSYDTNF